MAGSLNRVQIIGKLGRDPESRSFQNGGKVVNLRIATSERWKDRSSGERKERTEWHQVAIFNEATADFVEKYMRKGSLVYVEGQLETRKWQDQAGNDRYSTEIVVRPYSGDVKALDNSSGDERGDTRDAANGGPNGRRPLGGFDSDVDDDVPFLTCDPAYEPGFRRQRII